MKNKQIKFIFRLIILTVINSIILSYYPLFAKTTEKTEDVFDSTLSSKITPQNYGDWAEYNVDLNDNGSIKDDWKIFYNDGKYVYLIAADYLDASKIPEEAGMTTTGKYSAYWKDESEFANKQGMENVSTETSNQFMLDKYKLFPKYQNVQDINSKATAVLLDTNVWKKFALGFEGSFAYGSPTVEMWVDSWNQKGYAPLYTSVIDEDSHTQKTCDTCGFDNSDKKYEDNGYGYRVGTKDHNYEEKLNVSEIKDGFDDVLYFPHKEVVENTNTYFLASPTYRQEELLGTRHQSFAECVSGDTDITTSLEGNTKKANEIQKGDQIVYCYSNLSSSTDIDWTKKFMVGKVKDVYIHENATKFVKYTFDDGTSLKVTSYHPIYSKEGWKSFTQRNGYPLPVIGDEIKTLNDWKTLTAIDEFTGNENYYDFTVEYCENAGYIANNTLVQSSINAKTKDVLELGGTYHTYIDYFMDCLVSCTYNGIVGNTQLNIEQSNAAIRPLVVLPTNTSGYLENGIWILGKLNKSESENQNGDSTTESKEDKGNADLDKQKGFQFPTLLPNAGYVFITLLSVSIIVMLVIAIKLYIWQKKNSDIN